MTPQRARTPAPVPATAEDGVGVVSSLFGVLAFLGFVLLVVQVVLHMFTASIVQTAALDGAAHGAGAAQVSTVRAGQARAVAVLGGLADGATVTGEVRADTSGRVLRITVSVPPPSPVLRGLGVTRIERSADARVER